LIFQYLHKVSIYQLYSYLIPLTFREADPGLSLDS